MPEEKRTDAPRARTRRAERVAVPCCSCGEPTTMKVDPQTLLEVEILHLCTTCFRKLDD